jgi:hypothetical protein
MKNAVFWDATTFSQVEVRRLAPRPLKMKAMRSSEIPANFAGLTSSHHRSRRYEDLKARVYFSLIQISGGSWIMLNVLQIAVRRNQ